MTKNQVVGTMGISQAIESMIEESYKFLIFVSPYVKITERIKAKLFDTFQKADDVYFIYRKNELKNDQRRWLESFTNVHLIGVENLHAKVYLNEKYCVLTSMNFYEYSQINNYEIGVVFEAKRDKESFLKTVNEVFLMTRLSEKYDKIYHSLEPFLDFTVSKLYNMLSEISEKYNTRSADAYVRFCNAARKIVDFKENELYQDKGAVLRSANIGKERFEKIFNQLK